MGAHPYWYFVKYNPDVQTALDELRDREFAAGRYNPVVSFLDFPLAADAPAPGPQHESIEEALHASDADGTRSILDLFEVYEEPGYGGVSPLSEDELMRHYGTTKPTRRMVEENMDFLEDVERGMGVYIVMYEKDAPSEILFAGYSFD